jgi:mRNA-degrading endonuclease RelE of RelBE toxin-antitoxin system
MAKVLLTADAVGQVHRLPGGMIRRINETMERLQNWPDVSGAKALRRELKGHWRIRCGDWRIVFRPVGETVYIVGVDNRRDVYEEV